MVIKLIIITNSEFHLYFYLSTLYASSLIEDITKIENEEIIGARIDVIENLFEKQLWWVCLLISFSANVVCRTPNWYLDFLLPISAFHLTRVFSEKFGQLIACTMRNIFLKESYTKCGGETSPRPFSEKSKLSISTNQ